MPNGDKEDRDLAVSEPIEERFKIVPVSDQPIYESDAVHESGDSAARDGLSPSDNGALVVYTRPINHDSYQPGQAEMDRFLEAARVIVQLYNAGHIPQQPRLQKIEHSIAPNVVDRLIGAYFKKFSGAEI
ncbi:hypothetical protein PCANC_28244 [Puccinia coronata f. sp. avenae]|uniref:Uncharacterized protein n=1 Tax=Puccinia coronata f. sp. avenae TaxID=200324 RepID=A0A2N5RWY6_9BASI|nr:hypothetical protein PCANC_28244 [Puccinia coronata f. sp. avenae]